MKMRKNSKAMGIRKLLKKGYTPAQIKEHMDVSDSYIHAIKTRLAAEEAAPKEVEAAATTIRPSYDPEAGEYIVVEGAKSAQEIDAILNARASSYGSFATQAKIAQRLKHVAHTAAGEQGKTFAHDQAEALDMIFGKVARIVNGDPNHIDSWIDIAGYATLVADRLQGKIR
jgi:hypothetical protein